MPHVSPEEQREIVKQALQEWLDKQFATLGRWTFRGLCSMGFAALIYMWLTSQGWHK